jgi:hypothetical protein
MTWLDLILAGVRIFSAWMSWRGERNVRRKELKRKALNDMKEGLHERDPVKITAGYDTINSI